ncbi:GNAT family N-acetyltransferase [Candidatus Woesearchaeota archaeon]|nr:GNAT family N-acetyltransferase [Candidatus Woesearchaeota archaeon]
MKIKSLSTATIKQASALTLKLFEPSPKDEDYPPRWFSASIDPKKHLNLFEEFKVKKLKYYVAIDEKTKKIIGTTGFYTSSQDEKEAYWLGWWCVDEKYRNKGVGTKLLEFIINKARKAKKKFLRAYTSTDPHEYEAQKIYEKHGFKVFKEESIPEKPYKKLYRELKL